jgi:replicative DNA helicase
MALTPNRLTQAEFARVIFAVTPEYGTKIEDVLKPEYWAHVASKLKPRCRIEVLAEDNSYFAELLVVTCGKTFASVTVLRHIDLTGKVAKPQTAPDNTEGLGEFSTADHYVDYVQGQSKGRVIQRATKIVVKDGFASKKEAAKWMRDHEAELIKQQESAKANLQ